tara:strand:+ start:914 stop:1804 length:891 start_codon:yes stop_codon:yes gene_type:complete
MRPLFFKTFIVVITLSVMVISLFAWSNPIDSDVKNMIIADPVLGWRHPPNSLFRHHSKEFDVLTTFDNRGWRVDGGRTESERTILFLGDSLVEAMQVQDDRTSSAVLAKLTNHNVINLGMSNFGIGQQVLTYLSERQHYPKADYVVVVISALHANRTGNSMVFGVSGRLRARPAFFVNGPWLCKRQPLDWNAFRKLKGGESFAGNATTHFPTYTLVTNVNHALIVELRRIVKIDGAELVVVDLSSDFGSAGEWVNEIGAIKLNDCLECRWPKDGHYNDKGNRQIALLIAGFIQENK